MEQYVGLGASQKGNGGLCWRSVPLRTHSLCSTGRVGTQSVKLLNSKAQVYDKKDSHSRRGSHFRGRDVQDVLRRLPWTGRKGKWSGRSCA
jgi:hypothetical protein